MKRKWYINNEQFKETCTTVTIYKDPIININGIIENYNRNQSKKEFSAKTGTALTENQENIITEILNETPEETPKDFNPYDGSYEALLYFLRTNPDSFLRAIFSDVSDSDSDSDDSNII